MYYSWRNTCAPVKFICSSPRSVKADWGRRLARQEDGSLKNSTSPKWSSAGKEVGGRGLWLGKNVRVFGVALTRQLLVQVSAWAKLNTLLLRHPIFYHILLYTITTGHATLPVLWVSQFRYFAIDLNELGYELLCCEYIQYSKGCILSNAFRVAPGVIFMTCTGNIQIYSFL